MAKRSTCWSLAAHR